MLPSPHLWLGRAFWLNTHQKLNPTFLDNNRQTAWFFIVIYVCVLEIYHYSNPALWGINKA